MADAGHEIITYFRSNSELLPGLTGRAAAARRLLWSRDVKREISQLLLREKPDVAHVHNTFLMISPSVFLACRKANVPVVHTLHNYRLLCPGGNLLRDGKVCRECITGSLLSSVAHGCYRGSRSMTAAVATGVAFHRTRGTWTREVDRFLAPSEFVRKVYVSAGLPSHLIAVKPHFVYDPGPNEKVGEYAIYVGRLSPEKGVRTLINAWRRASLRIPLVVVGDGPLRPELEAEAPACVTFLGALPSEQTIAVMKRARFLIFPSECFETFGIAIAEAFACSVPAVCSRLGAMEEMVEDGQTGLQFAPGDTADLAAKVSWAWANSREMARMGAEARRTYEARYSPARNRYLLESVYYRAIEERHGVERPLPLSEAA